MKVVLNVSDDVDTPVSLRIRPSHDSLPEEFRWFFKTRSVGIFKQSESVNHRDPTDIYHYRSGVVYDCFNNRHSSLQSARAVLAKLYEDISDGRWLYRFPSEDANTKPRQILVLKTKTAPKRHSTLSTQEEQHIWDSLQPFIGPRIQPDGPRPKHRLHRRQAHSDGTGFASQASNQEKAVDKEYLQESDFDKNFSEANRKSFKRQILAMKRLSATKTSKVNSNSDIKNKKKEKQDRRILRSDEDFQSQINIGLVHKLDKKTAELISKATERFGKIFEDCGGDVASAITQTKESIDHGLGIADNFKVFLWIALAAAVGYVILFKAPAHRLLLIGALSAIIPSMLWDSISHIFSGDEFSSQGPINMSWLSHIITIMMSYFVLGGCCFTHDLRNIFKFLPNYSRTVAGIGDLGSFIIGNIEHCLNWIRSKFGQGPVSLVKTGKPEVDAFLNKVDFIVSQATTQEIPAREFLLSLQELRHTGSTLLLTNRWAPIFQRPIEKCLGQLDALISANSPALHAMKSTRVEPTLVALIGPPRVGKTLIMNALTELLLAASLDPSITSKEDYDPREHVYARCSCNEYWTGYFRQFLVICDDFGQALPTGGESNCFAELVNMCSSAPFCPPQAAVEDKGRHYFDSKFVLLSTNLLTLKDSYRVIASPKALAERLELSYKVVPKREYTKPSPICPDDMILDGDEFSRFVEETGQFPWHMWNFYQHNYDKPDVHQEPVTHIQFIQSIIDRYRRNTKRFNGINDVGASLKELGLSFQSQMGLFSHKKRDISSHRVDIKCSEIPPDDSVSELVSIRDELKSSLGSIFDKLGTWLTSNNFKVILCLIATPFLTKMILSAVHGVFKMVFKPLFKLFGLVAPGSDEKKNRKRNINNMRKLVSELDEEELDEITQLTATKVSSKQGNKLSKLCSHVLKPAMVSQSNAPQMREPSVKRVVQERSMESQVNDQKESLNDSLAKNQFILAVHNGKVQKDLGTLTVLENDFCMLPLHFFTYLNDSISSDTWKATDKVKFINVWTPNHVFEMPLGVFMTCVVLKDEVKHIALFKLPSLQKRRSIVDKFILKADVEYLHKCDVRLETARIESSRLVRYLYYGPATRDLQTHVDKHSSPYTILNGWRYNIGTKNGDCGSLVTLTSDKWVGKRVILGFHVAGVNETGLGTGLTQEYVRDMLDSIDSVKSLPLPAEGTQEVFFSQNGNGESLFVAEEGVSQNPTSKLFKTSLHNKWYNSDKLPALLRNSGDIDPLAKVRSKYLRPHVHLDQELVDNAAYEAFKPFFRESQDDSRRILTFREAVAGCPQLNNGFKGLKRGTSAGYPYNAKHFDGKRDFFGKTGEFEFTSQACLDLEREVRFYIELAQKKIRGLHIYTDFLKDELRSKAKVLEGNSRMISAAPLAYTILFRMYFGAFTSSVEKHRIETGPAVGINPYLEWDRIVRFLNSKGPYIIAGDYKGFDHTSRPQNQDAILARIQDWYDDEHNSVREVLWMELKNSIHLTGTPGTVARQVYAWVGGMPSGFPGTTTINCFDNIIDMIIAYNKTTELPISTFWDKVALVVYGDDNIMSVDPSVIERFNQQTIPTAMSEIGREYTDDKKNGEVSQPYRTLDEVTFLKRSFRQAGHIYLAPLDIESTLCIPYWGKTHVGEKETLVDMVECCLQELSLHPPEIWDTYASKIIGSCQKFANIVPKLNPTYKNYQMAVRNRTESWF